MLYFCILISSGEGHKAAVQKIYNLTKAEINIFLPLLILLRKNDLEILSDLECVYAEKNTLTRYLLFENEKFMKILFDLLTSEHQKLAEAAWKMVARLPLNENFPYEANIQR